MSSRIRMFECIRDIDSKVMADRKKNASMRKHRMIPIVPVKVRFPETGDRFWDGARFEHFLDAISYEGFEEGVDWKYYRRGNHYQILVLNLMIFKDPKVDKIWTRYGLVPDSGSTYERL